MSLKPVYIDTADGVFKQSNDVDIVFPVPDNMLVNGGFDIFQRTAPGTLTNRSDDQYGADRWYNLNQSNPVQIQRTSGTFTKSPFAIQISQANASAQRFGIAQIVEGYMAKPRRSRAVTFNCQLVTSASATIRVAILEWTGTLDSPTSDVVNDWTSGTYTAGNFFLSSNLTVAAVGSAVINTTGSITLTATLSSSCNNIIVFIWTESTQAQNFTLGVGEASLYDGVVTLPWLPVAPHIEINKCFRYYEKSYPLAIAPGTTNSFAGLEDFYTRKAIAASTSGGIAYGWLFLQTKRIVPTVTLYNPGSGATGSVRINANSRSGATAGQVGQRGVGNLQFDNTSAQAIALDDEVFYQWDADAEL